MALQNLIGKLLFYLQAVGGVLTGAAVAIYSFQELGWEMALAGVVLSAMTLNWIQEHRKAAKLENQLADGK